MLHGTLALATVGITTRSTSTTAGIEEKQRAGGVTPRLYRVPDALFPCYSTPLPKESQHQQHPRLRLLSVPHVQLESRFAFCVFDTLHTFDRFGNDGSGATFLGDTKLCKHQLSLKATQYTQPLLASHE